MKPDKANSDVGSMFGIQARYTKSVVIPNWILKIEYTFLTKPSLIVALSKPLPPLWNPSARRPLTSSC